MERKVLSNRFGYKYKYVIQKLTSSNQWICLNASEIWTLRARHEHKLNAVHMRCLRRILNIKWQDKIPNTSVLEKAGISSICTVHSS